MALSEEAFGAAVSLGGVGSLAVGAWLMVERGAPARRIAERSAVLFLYTSAINVITLILAGVGLFLGLPGRDNPLLSIVPAAVGALVLVLFLLLPRYVDRIVRRVPPGRLHAFLTETAASVRDTERLVFHPDWRIVGAIGYLWFDIAVLFACFAAAGQTPPLAPVVLAYQIGYLSNFIPVPGGIGVLDGSMIGMLFSTASAGRWPPRPPSSTTRFRCGSRRSGARSHSSCCRRPRSSRSSSATRPRNCGSSAADLTSSKERVSLTRGSGKR